jgi:long-subunit acyl-CoA synthetase (AMP-forming)
MEDERMILMSTKGYQNLVGSDDGKNLFWTTEINTELPIKMKQFGPGSEAPITLCQMFKDTAQRIPHKNALNVERNGKVLKWTWGEYYRDASLFAKAMHVVGITERKCVNIMGHNAPEWVIAFQGGTMYNCITSGVYPTNNADACLYQADHSEAEIIVVDSIDQAKKY